MSSFVHTVTVLDPIGLHARPVGQIVTLVRETGATVTLRSASGSEAAATSALKMLALKVKTGETLEIVVESAGSSEPEALAREIESLINQG
ncbi:MAG: HPr family phosphocarrier protein [Microbacteriaceae bacterium]|jgi:phosphocarrier protein HPr|nr:HPr family phosphocarrier protein [Microbacteriaceae bacterium]